MLVLTRKSQERIQIGDNICITIVRIKGKSVRVGIEAPNDVRVVRGELALKEEAATVHHEEQEEPVEEDTPVSALHRHVSKVLSSESSSQPKLADPVKPSNQRVSSSKKPALENQSAMGC